MNNLRKLALIGLGMAVLSMTAMAQSANPVAEALKGSLRQASGRMVAAAEEMPAAKYNFKPTPGSRTFGALMLHIAQSNDMMCHTVAGGPAAPRVKLTATSPKAELVAAMKASFAYCGTAFAHLTDSGLNAQVPFFGGRKISRAAYMFALSDDWADHYSQEAAYLRANGMLPPTARKGSTV